MESLYRKYRPLTFESVVGQRHIVSTLEHAITEGRLSHAYLFCGPRGTGKTTMARILAKALLCERAAAARAEGASGCMPDGSCEECQRIAEGTHPDVYELDAASRTGVDNVREEIINSVSFAPVRGAYKIYIIDEVHMLTTQAFNALLKTLEEPPEHVLFVLCTTDPQKIPETILSRCQRFDFHRIGNEDIVGRLAYICEQEGFDYDAEALEIVAKHARGGMRDALSTLEQLSVFGNGSVHASDARALLGEVSGTVLSEFSRAIAARDVATLFGLVRTQVDAGEDLMELTRDLVAHTRDIYMVSVAGARPELFDGAEDVEALAEEAGLFGTADRLARALTVLDDAALEMRTAADTRLVLEIALTRLARPESDLTLEALAERIDRLESRIASGVPAAPLDASGVAALAGVRGAVAKAPVPNEAKASMPTGAPVSAEAPAPAGTSGSAGTSKPDKVSAPAGAAVSAAEQAFAPVGAKAAEFAGEQMASPVEGGASAFPDAIAHPGWHGQHRAGHQSGQHAGQGSFHAGDGNDDGCRTHGVNMRRQAMQTGDAHVGNKTAVHIPETQSAVSFGGNAHIRRAGAHDQRLAPRRPGRPQTERPVANGKQAGIFPETSLRKVLQQQSALTRVNAADQHRSPVSRQPAHGPEQSAVALAGRKDDLAQIGAQLPLRIQRQPIQRVLYRFESKTGQSAFRRHRAPGHGMQQFFNMFFLHGWRYMTDPGVLPVPGMPGLREEGGGDTLHYRPQRAT